MTAMRFLTDLRERSVNSWVSLITRSRTLEMVEMLDRHELKRPNCWRRYRQLPNCDMTARPKSQAVLWPSG